MIITSKKTTYSWFIMLGKVMRIIIIKYTIKLCDKD